VAPNYCENYRQPKVAIWSPDLGAYVILYIFDSSLFCYYVYLWWIKLIISRWMLQLANIRGHFLWTRYSRKPQVFRCNFNAVCHSSRDVSISGWCGHIPTSGCRSLSKSFMNTEFELAIVDNLRFAVEKQELSHRKQIARQLRTQYVEGIYDNLVTLKSRLTATQGHWKRNHWVDHTRLTDSRVIGRWILSWP